MQKLIWKQSNMKNKKGIEFSFAWMFSIIVGAVIIFLAIYGATRLVRTERAVSEAEVAKQLEILLNPVETSIEEGKISRILFVDETRLYNNCRAEGTFGVQRIRTSTISGIGEEWSTPGIAATMFNKYIFSSEIIQGEEIEIFSKPFNMPFKVADVLVVWSDQEEYCFVDPPANVEEEINSLNPRGINMTSDVDDCKEGSIVVCFATSGCDVDVSMITKRVTKNGESVRFDDSFDDSLLYGAIFADAELYECQLERLMKRASELSLVYKDKAGVLSREGCSTNLEADLVSFANAALEIEDSFDLGTIVNIAKSLGVKNDVLSCRLF